jgi:dynein heavy chain
LGVFKNSQSGALTQNLEQDSLGWKRWYAEEKAELADLPRSFRDLSAFHRLILLRVLRPDRLSSALMNFVEQNLGGEFVEQQPFDMEQTYKETSAMTPMFFVLFPGTDPTPMVENMGRRLNVTSGNGKFVNLSMGQGQETIAINALNKCAKEGGWIMLQNIHLMQNWLKTLERSLELIEDFVHPDFRCILTSEPPNALLPLMEIVPESILQKCVKVADEAPQDIKSNLRRTWSKFGQETIDKSSKPREFKACLFGLCFFHSLVVGRKRFGAQGWSRAYPFNDGDLTISAAVLHNYLEKYENVPWPDLRYLFGEIFYGGHVTDKWDRRTTNTYLEVLLVPELLQNMNLAPGFKSPDAAKMDYAAYAKYVEERVPAEAPQMFGLHPNAEIGFLTTQGNNIFMTILEVQGGAKGGGGGDSLSGVGAILTAYLTQLPKNLDMMEIRGRVKEWSPYVIVSLQESERMNTLLSEIRRSLTELEMGLSGALNVTEQMEALAIALSLNRVPASWEKLAYFSLKPLARWFGDLIERVNQLVEWTNLLGVMKSLWISGLFNPMSYLTAVMQMTARQYALPLDYMTNRSHFTNYNDVKDVPNHPSKGVYVHGLFMEGAGWEPGKGEEEGYITDSKLKELHPPMPVVNIFAVHVDKMTWDNMYHCPVFVTSMRGPTFVFLTNVRMDADDNENRWILAGAAILLTDD